MRGRLMFVIVGFGVLNGCLSRVADVLTAPQSVAAGVAQHGVQQGGGFDSAVADVDRIMALRPENAEELGHLREALMRRMDGAGAPSEREGTCAADPEHRRDHDRRAEEELRERDRWRGPRMQDPGDEFGLDVAQPGRDLYPVDRPVGSRARCGMDGPIPWHVFATMSSY